MKRTYKFLACLLGGLFLFSLSQTSCSDNSKKSLDGYQKIRSDSSFYNAVTRIENIQLVDIRSEEEYRAGHIPCATNVEANYVSADDVNSVFCKEIQALFDKNRDIFLYGGKRQAAENWYAPALISTVGWKHKHTYHYLNNYEKWVSCGYPICNDSTKNQYPNCPCHKTKVQINNAE